MGAITEVYSYAAQATQSRRADMYDIIDGPRSGWWGAPGGGGAMDDAENDWWNASGRWEPTQACGGWHAHEQQWAGWQYGGDNAHHAAYNGGAMDLSEIRVPRWMQQRDGNENAGWSSRADKRWRAEFHDQHGMQGRHLGPKDAAADHEEAARLQARCNDAAAAAAAAEVQPAPPTPTQEEAAADAAAAEALERRRRAVWDQAQMEDVQVAGEAIAGMDAHELEEWAQANLM